MDKIYSIVRKLHLYASLVIATFLLMYFLTGMVMIMGKIFPRKNVSDISEKIALRPDQTFEEAMKGIIQGYGINGFENKVDRPDGTSYTYTRPAYRAEIYFNKKEGSFRVSVRKATFWAAMNDFHRLRGFSGLAHFVWAILYDLSCIALLVFAVTGVYLWWRLERKKIWGTVVIFISTGITVFTIWYLVAVG